MSKSKIFAALIVIALIAAFFIFDLGQYFSLDYFKSQQAAFTEQYAANPIKTAISECMSVNSAIASCGTLDDLKLPAPGATAAFKSLTVAAGVITMTPQEGFKGIKELETCTLSPTVNAAAITKWTFGGACVTAGYVKP